MRYPWWAPLPGLLIVGFAQADAPDAIPAATRLGDVVVTAPTMDEPLIVTTDPKAPRQPVPAHDGADYLKTIPGFSVIRKGGTDGDPVFRGMAASRLNILLDGENILGGCGMRMDPPTAYIFPESYDRITLIKGPQTVLYGPGNSAGTVLFERDIRRFDPAGWRFNGSLTVGSFGRNDQVADVRAGTPEFYAQGTATRSDSDDYEDGDGTEVHSAYTRWSTSAALGWTPDADTRIELTGVRSNGEAAYADRGMDGIEFARENVGIKLDKRNLSERISRLEAQVYYNYVDHVMDNYSLRTVASPMARMVSNPDRETVGTRVALGVRLGAAMEGTFGIDYQANDHSLRSAMGAAVDRYTDLPRVEDAEFRSTGLFGELSRYVGERGKLIGGLRLDDWHAQDQRTMLTIGSGMMAQQVANPTANRTRDPVLTSGFGRYEHDLAALPATLYAGLGHTQRFPDYWELVGASKEGVDSPSAFDADPEKTTQLDLGLIYTADRLSTSVSGFVNRIDDYLLVQTNYLKPALSGMGTRTATAVRNIDATTWGGEASANYRLTQTWMANASLAYVRGENETDGTPLAQLPPLEARLGLGYDDGTWSAGSLLRLVAEQDRVDIGKGNVVGQDIGRTPGFAVFSLNAGYRPTKGMLIAAGIDNLFDRTYAEHISRSGAMIAGFDQTLHVNEPGRNLWLKLSLALD